MQHATQSKARISQSEHSSQRYPDAPHGWTPARAGEIAAEQGILLTQEHFETLRALQAYYANTEHPRIRELVDALDERFHTRGGLKHLYTLFPGGPVAQGCRLAGLSVPPGAEDRSFGSVQ